MGERSMLPIEAILNQSPRPRPGTPNSQPSASELSSLTSDVNDAFPPAAEGRPGTKSKRTRDSSDLSYTKPQGLINYSPHEALDEVAYNQMRPFDVWPFGQIAHYCAHIPYSSDKKDVFEKTGRDNFNVFVYRFTDPNDRQTSYDVMWDYLGGFVRISPFFKSLKHKKTGPAKMLEANKGLRDISFHMTGGNRVAQGYWVPYSCARAVCATFCYPIAGALIPIFGPDFPKDCVKPGSPRYGRMDIDEKIISDAKFRVSAYRHASPNNFPKPSSVTSHPQPFQDPYSMSMKERLEQYSVLKAHTGSSYTWGSIGNHYLNTSPPAGHVAWRSTPERENFGRPLNPSPPWAPINSPKIGGSDPPAVDPLLSAIPHLTKGDRYPPCSFAEFKRGNQDPLKRYFNGNGTIHKRRKVEYEPCIPQGLVGIHQYSNVVVAHTPSEAHQVPARPNEPIIPSPRETVPSSKPQDRSGERSEYTHEEREAVFALLSMHQGLSDDPGTASRNAKRLRAKSI